jgi:hypothetical protein
MDVGLLWFDNDSRRDLEAKVLRAAAHYQKKHGEKPNVCFVHPTMLSGNGNGSSLHADGVEIRAGRSILPDHFWIGVAQERPA